MDCDRGRCELVWVVIVGGVDCCDGDRGGVAAVGGDQERCIRNVVGGDRGKFGLLWEVIDGGVECCGRCVLLWEVIARGTYCCER